MMDRFFGSGNPLWRGMEKIFDVFILNTLWLLCCIPVFTIGPATTAFYYAMFHLVRGADTYVSRDFFRSFVQNFKQGILLGLPLTAIGAFLALDIRLCYHAGTGIYTFFMVFFAILFLFWAFITLYSFVLLSKFERKNKDLLLWAFVLSIRHIGRTVLMFAVLCLALWACHLLPGLIFIAFGLTAEFQSVLFAPILKPYLPDTEVQEDLKPLTFDVDKMQEVQSEQEK